jgi:hypothetical protein
VRPPASTVFAQLAVLHRERSAIDTRIASAYDELVRSDGVGSWTSARLPPGRSRRWFAEFCLARLRAGDRRVRKLNARTWEADRTLFEEGTPAPREPRAIANDTEAAWTPAAALATAGLRPRRERP